MSVTIRNASDHRILLRFNSGQTHHLDPGESVDEVLNTEVRDNRQIQRLRHRRMIQMDDTPSAGRTSDDMTAEEAASHIRSTPTEHLERFLADDESRKTVLEAWEDKFPS